MSRKDRDARYYRKHEEKFMDSPELLSRAAGYIEAHRDRLTGAKIKA